MTGRYNQTVASTRLKKRPAFPSQIITLSTKLLRTLSHFFRAQSDSRLPKKRAALHESKVEDHRSSRPAVLPKVNNRKISSSRFVVTFSILVFRFPFLRDGSPPRRASPHIRRMPPMTASRTGLAVIREAFAPAGALLPSRAPIGGLHKTHPSVRRLPRLPQAIARRRLTALRRLRKRESAQSTPHLHPNDPSQSRMRS
jgi:hypothetical protein